MKAVTRRVALALLAGAATFVGVSAYRRKADAAKAQSVYAQPLPAPTRPMRIFHLGHSLVGRDMPAMLAQLAGADHLYDSQLGWGTSLKQHWEPGEPINGFDVENDHPRFRPAQDAVQSGAYDALVLTEMVEIKDALRYHDSASYLGRWAAMARAANPNVRIYLYETWHNTDDPGGWLNRIDTDLAEYWQGRILYPALVATDAPIHLIPAGQVMAAFVRKVQAAGPDGIGNITRIEDLFDRNADGTPDTIHFNDIGAYLVALTHFAVLYHRTPVGLPHQLDRADGTAAITPSAEAARVMQETVWDVVGRHPETGVAA